MVVMFYIRFLKKKKGVSEEQSAMITEKEEDNQTTTTNMNDKISQFNSNKGVCFMPREQAYHTHTICCEKKVTRDRIRART